MRLFFGKFTESTQSLRYEWYVRGMPRLFDVLALRSSEIISTNKGMNKLTLDMLAPAMTAPESRIVRMSMCDLTETAIPLFSTGRLVLHLKECLMWARRFSPEDIVEVENVGLCRFVVHILGLVVETQQTLKVIPGLRVTHELGWMAHNEMADATLRTAGLLQSAHARHCLVEIENAVGIEWLSMFLIRLAPENFVRGIRDVLINTVCFEVNYSFSSMPTAPASRGTMIVLWLVFCQNRHGELVFFLLVKSNDRTLAAARARHNKCSQAGLLTETSTELPWRPNGCPGLLFISFVPLRPSTSHQLRWHWPPDCGRSDQRPATRADVQPNLQWKQQKPRGAWPAFEQHSTVILATAPRGHQGTSGCPVPIQAGRRAGPEYCARKVV
ncbi:hypothetical protein MRX96_057671 [Rhipicephalus microplus]